MARSDVQALIQRIEDANKALDYAPSDESGDETVKVASLPAIDVAKLPDVVVDGLAKQLEAIAKRPTGNKDIVAALARVAAELSNKPDAIDLSGVIRSLDRLAQTDRPQPDYNFTVNRDSHGFIASIRAEVVQK